MPEGGGEVMTNKTIYMSMYLIHYLNGVLNELGVGFVKPTATAL